MSEYFKFQRDEWTDESLVDQLSGAMSVLTSLARERGLAHTTEVGFRFVLNLILTYLPFLQVVPLDDESYWDFKGPLPQCKGKESY